MSIGATVVTDERNNERENTYPSETGGTPGAIGLGQTYVKGNQTGGSCLGPTVGRASKGDPRREVRGDSSEVRDNIRTGSQPGVSQLDPSEALMQAFLEGDFNVAYTAALNLQQFYRELASEVSSLRFRLNFGTSLCRDCEGLRAGPGVIATCYQIQKCDFRNLKETDRDPRKERVVSLLGVSEE